MASNYPLHLDEEERDFASRWASSILVGALVFLTLIMIVAALWPEARASEAAWKRHVAANCRSANCLSPMQILTPERAAWMKRELGGRVLVVDIGMPGEPPKTAPRVHVDAYVPFTETVFPDVLFRIDFCGNVDEVLRAAGLRHDQPVILVSPSMERTMLAALLLQEHGYSNILAMNS